MLLSDQTALRNDVAAAVDAEREAMDRALALAVFSVEGTVLRPNANFLKLFGYKARELIGQKHAVLLAGDAVEAGRALWQSLAQGEMQRGEFLRRRQDGTPIWVRAAYTPVADATGRVAEVVLFATDVTADNVRGATDRGQIDAINTSQAVIHFALDGTITEVNPRFLEAVGYTRDELLGAHHRLLVDPAEADAADHRAFWHALAEGRHHAGTYRRVGKGGRCVWLQASYHPIFDSAGRPSKVVTYATDVTAERSRRLGDEGQIAAIDKSHAVITFDLHGTVLHANQNFLDAVGYRLDEVEGRHHRMFVEPSHAHGPEYAAFWSRLADGHHQSGEYRRFGKHGREVWLQASYNPVHDAAGRLSKVVKYATVVTREKLRQADHQGQIASIHKAQCVISFALDGTILDANDNFLDATGYRLSEVRGRHHRMFVDAATATSDAYRAFWDDLARGRHVADEFKRVCKDGREIWLQATYNPILDMSGHPFKVVKYATNVTEERLRQVDNQGQIAAIHKSQCVVAFDLDGHVLEANDNFLSAMGYERGEVIGQHHRLFADLAFAHSQAYAKFWETLRSGRFVAEKCRRVGKGGREVWLQASYNPILDLNGRPLKVLKIATDVTASVALAAQVVSARQEAEHDATTGLPNRLGLRGFLASVLAPPGQRLALLYLDLDHFKPINDTFGHATGDQVLKETANRLREALAPGQMAARIGGDEFIVAAPGLADEQIDPLCQRLLDAVKAPIRHANCTITVGLSIGVAVAPGDATAPDDLMRCADIALYRTKGNGRDGYSCFAQALHERLSADRHLAGEMRHGIQAGQFALEYHPQIDTHTHACERVEARVRWLHPSRGVIEQPEFIVLAEKSALILPLGEWVLRNACAAAAARPGLVVVVPVSPVQFAGVDLAVLVATVLAETGLAPTCLTLALPERVLHDDPGRARAGLAALKSLGVRLLLDDTGPAHVSLAGLRDLGLDEVKVDPLFVADLEPEDGGAAIAESIRQTSEALRRAGPPAGVVAREPLLWLSLRTPETVRAVWRGAPMSTAPMSTAQLSAAQLSAAQLSRSTRSPAASRTNTPV